MKFDGKTYTHSTLEEGYDFKIKDKRGKAYHFKVATFLCPGGQLSEAIEFKKKHEDPRYFFRVLTPFDSDIEKAELLLKAKIKKGIDRRHLEVSNGHLIITDKNTLRGRIESSMGKKDTEFDQVLIIDGKRITIEEFARLIDGYEGWDFKLEMADRTDDND